MIRFAHQPIMGSPRFNLCRFALPTVWLLAFLGSIHLHGATLDVSPARVGNDYTGFVTLQIAGLATNETVLVQKYLDVNSNGVVDAADLFVQQFQITEGAGPSMIGGATNMNIPYDSTGSDGAITARLCLEAQGVLHRIVGQYVYVVSSPSNDFATVTQTLAVTNAAYGQSIAGTVLSNSVAAPFAPVFVMADDAYDEGWMTGVVADSAGQYSISLPAGSYTVFAWQRGCAGAPVFPVDVAASTTVITNLTLVASDTTISGRAVDSTNSNIGVGGLLLAAMGDTYAIAVTDSNGNFTLPVNAGEQYVSTEPFSCSSLGYLMYSATNVDAWTNISGLQLTYARGDALVYGRVLDDNNTPLAGVRLQMNLSAGFGYDLSLYANGETVADGDGNYALPALAGENWSIYIDENSVPVTAQNYLLPYAYDYSVTTSNGFAYRQDLVALRPTYTLSGFLRDDMGVGIAGVSVSASLSTNGLAYSTGTNTDASGFYSLNVPAGAWIVQVACHGFSPEVLPAIYECPPASMVTISNVNATLDITVSKLDGFLAGSVVDDLGVPLADMLVAVTPTLPPPSGTSGRPIPIQSIYVSTDTNGQFQLPIESGSYTLSLNKGRLLINPASLGLVTPEIPVTIPSGGSVTNLIMVAKHTAGSITLTVTNTDTMQPVSNVDFTVSAVVQGTNYSAANALTDTNGAATMQVCDGDWVVQPYLTWEFGGLRLTTPDPQTAHVTNNSVTLNFLVHGIPPPLLSLPSRKDPSQFQLHLNGTIGGTYTLQYATALTNWITFAVTNVFTPDVLIIDTNASDGVRFYRALQGP